MIWFIERLGYDFEHRIHRNRRCRQQRSGSLDCGVHVLWWAEAYARNEEKFWDTEKIVDITPYRMEIALRFLRDAKYVRPIAMLAPENLHPEKSHVREDVGHTTDASDSHAEIKVPKINAGQSPPPKNVSGSPPKGTLSPTRDVTGTPPPEDHS